MKFDEDRVTRLSSEISVALNGLREISDLSPEEFLHKKHLIAGAKYYLIVSIEAVIDLSNHLISQNNLRVSESYADTFKILADSDIIPEDLALRLMEMTKFRNRLVHIYWDIDDEIIYDVINEDIRDIEEFIDIYTKFLKEHANNCF